MSHSSSTHRYEIEMRWTGNEGEGTRSYRGYRRDHVIASSEKPDIPGSSDPAFRGDTRRWSPEELLVASLSSCHMLWYLHLCAEREIVAIAYEDSPRGVMEEDESGGGRFIDVELRPTVTIASDSDAARAAELHHEAHEKCFIANSVTFPVRVSPKIIVAESQPTAGRDPEPEITRR